MSKKVSKNSEKTAKFKNLTISERIQKCRELIYGIKEEKSEKVVINCETIDDENKLKSKDSRSQKSDECFVDLKVKAANSLDEERVNKYFANGIEDESEILNNIKHEKEVNFDEIGGNFYKNPPKIRECRIILKDLKMEISNKKFKNLSLNSDKIGTQCSKNDKNSVNLESNGNCSKLSINFASINNSEQEKINKNVKTEPEQELLVILPTQKIQMFPVPIKIEDNKPKNKRAECHICGKNYLKKHLPGHIRNLHENPRSFKCEICNVRCNTKLNLNSHQKIHDKNRPKQFKCNKCSYATDIKSRLRKHSEIHEMTNRIKRCDKCNTILQKNVIHDCRLDCKHCGKIFSNKDMVRNHIKMDHDKETERSIYQCDICGLKLFRKNCLRIHMDKKHADGKINFFTCDFDGKKFKTKAEIRKHIAIHLPYVKCDFCNVQLNLEYLKLHVRKVHSGIKRPIKKSIPKKLILQCPHCPKILASKSGLYKHIRDHNKKIKCKFCEKLFGIQSRLKDHIREYHENPRSYVCNICDKKFSRAEHLKVHIKTHDPNRQRGIKCSLCDYATDRNSSLKIHLNSHRKKNAKISEIKNPHQCSHCPSVFGRKDLLRNHIRAVHPKANFECDICGQKIKVKRDMMVHLKNVHKIGS